MPGRFQHLFYIALPLWPALVAAQPTGSVRAADQFIPGATVTATQGEAKKVTWTDESGRYKLDPPPGVWNIRIEMDGFGPIDGQVTVSSEPGYKDWTLEMPRTAGSSSAPSVSQAAGRRGRRGFGLGQGPGRGAPRSSTAPQTAGAGTPAQAPRFQSAAVRATAAGANVAGANKEAPLQDLAEVENQATLGLADEDTEDAFSINGSTSGGLAQASDDRGVAREPRDGAAARLRVSRPH